MDEILKTVVRIETQQEILIADIADIKNKVSILPCEVNNYKIKNLQRVVYGAVAIILLAFMATLVDPVKTSVSKADRPAAVVYKVRK